MVFINSQISVIILDSSMKLVINVLHKYTYIIVISKLKKLSILL